MTPFLETLQSHKGGLIKIKTELYWYGGRGYDESPGRVCLLLDTATVFATAAAAATRTAIAHQDFAPAATYLLIDGSTHWVWMTKEDVELLPEKL